MPFPLLDGLDAVELQAIRLDGESYRLGDAHVPIDVVDSPDARATAILNGLPERVIAAGWTAAWVWGAAPCCPAVADYLVDLGARWRDRPGGVRISEAVVRDGDVVRLGSARVTSPLRTALDLARFADPDPDAAVFAALARIDGFTLGDALHALDRGANLPHKRRAAARLARALGARQPDLTR